MTLYVDTKPILEWQTDPYDQNRHIAHTPFGMYSVRTWEHTTDYEVCLVMFDFDDEEHEFLRQYRDTLQDGKAYCQNDYEDRKAKMFTPYKP